MSYIRVAERQLKLGAGSSQWKNFAAGTNCIIRFRLYAGIKAP
jgi:hypothetical protein